MIYAKKKDLDRYKGLSANLDTAIDFLLSADLNKLQMGRNEISGDQVFVNRFNYQTMTEEKAIWEGHIQYADIHVVLSGQEKIGVSHVDSLTPTEKKPEEDFLGFEGKVTAWLPMTTEDILIVFPEDIHKVKVIEGQSTLVEKACFKVKV
jgi:YhcH/YjgK/YiaL family protein